MSITASDVCACPACRRLRDRCARALIAAHVCRIGCALKAGADPDALLEDVVHAMAFVEAGPPS